MASSSSSELTFKLHPLVILNIFDHYTRLKSQSQPSHVAANGSEATTLPPRRGSSASSSASREDTRSRSSTALSSSPIPPLILSIRSFL
ncbi:COP9 signalosome complex subunit 6a [Camellia lanceoleosa]|uniref:COP9 signalosome complex subunit 6a n=1 Tax=Camellia lanceoleosa TaxID=1840588 RepID=A0ACC0J2N4_9ERIC|nr:COP9 signalosome complex subunit 6a [Camellia lanceoleosa]